MRLPLIKKKEKNMSTIETSKSFFFRVTPNSVIPVTIEDCGDVNIGATGTICSKTFARLAASVLAASNTHTGNWVGFPVCADLEDYKTKIKS